MLGSRPGLLWQGQRESPYLECYKPIHAPIDAFTFCPEWCNMVADIKILEEKMRCKNFVHLLWLRRSLVISSTWRVAPHCMDPEGTLDWWVKTEQGEMGQLLPLLETCSHQTAVKIGRWWKMSFFFLLLIIEWWGVWGSLKKQILKLDVVKKRKPGAKKGLDILEMLKKRRRVLFYVSRRQVENLNGVLELKKKKLNRGKSKINGEI